MFEDKLFLFQKKAAQQIAQRFFKYHYSERISHKKGKKSYEGIPFFQVLDSITGSGKTVILVKTISLMSESLKPKPIVLWLSKLSVVVKQSMTKLEEGGEYFDLFSGKLVTKWLDEYKETYLEENEHTLLLFATTGTFNQKDKEKGDRKIYACNIDNQSKSTWESLKTRKNKKGLRRELFIVYDEAQNLSNQQTELLLDLEPAAFLLASGTIQLPSRINEEFQIPIDKNILKKEKMITSISVCEVKEAELIKHTLHLICMVMKLQWKLQYQKWLTTLEILLPKQKKLA